MTLTIGEMSFGLRDNDDDDDDLIERYGRSIVFLQQPIDFFEGALFKWQE